MNIIIKRKKYYVEHLFWWLTHKSIKTRTWWINHLFIGQTESIWSILELYWFGSIQNCFFNPFRFKINFDKIIFDLNQKFIFPKEWFIDFRLSILIETSNFSFYRIKSSKLNFNWNFQISYGQKKLENVNKQWENISYNGCSFFVNRPTKENFQYYSWLQCYEELHLVWNIFLQWTTFIGYVVCFSKQFNKVNYYYFFIIGFGCKECSGKFIVCL